MNDRIFTRADLDAAVAVEREAILALVEAAHTRASDRAHGKTSYAGREMSALAAAIRARSTVAAPSYVREPPPPEAMGGPPRDELFGPAEEALAIANEMLLEQRDAMRAEVERCHAGQTKLTAERDAAEARAAGLEECVRWVSENYGASMTMIERKALAALAAHGKGAR